MYFLPYEYSGTNEYTAYQKFNESKIEDIRQSKTEYLRN